MSRKQKTGSRLRRFAFRGLLLLLVAAAVYVPYRAHRQREASARLERERDALRTELAQLLRQDPRLAAAPPGGVLIGAPAAFTSRLVHQLADGLLQQTEIRLRDKRVRKKGTVRVKTFLGRMAPGAYALDVRLHEVKGRLGAGPPTIRYADDRALVSLPASIRQGEGRGTIRFQWESRGLAGLACGDVDVTQAVSGSVIPHDYQVEGWVELSLDGEVVRAVPRFPDLEIRVYVDPSKESWAAVDRLLDSQGFRCRTALKLVDVPRRLKNELAKGFKVKIPSRIFKPIGLPAGFHDSVTVAGRKVALGVEPRGLLAHEDILWYGADLEAVHAVDLPAPSPLPLAAPVTSKSDEPPAEGG